MNHFPELLKTLPTLSSGFEAYRLSAHKVDVLFASYPAGTHIPMHVHPTENVGVVTQGELILTVAGVDQRLVPGEWYHLPALAQHAAQSRVDTATIEFWFKR